MAGRSQSAAKPAAAKSAAAGPARKKPAARGAARTVAAEEPADAATPEVADEAGASAALVRLGEVLDLNAAGPLAAELLALRGRDVEVDASAVQRMGAQCLQVLLSARATWDADGTAFALVAPSDEFASTVALLGAPIDQHFSTSELSA